MFHHLCVHRTRIHQFENRDCTLTRPTSKSELDRWLSDVTRLSQTLEEKGDADLIDHQELLLELGYSQTDINQMDAYVDDLLNKAKNHFEVNDMRAGLERLTEVFKLAPWRKDVLFELGRVSTELYVKEGQDQDAERAQEWLTRCIETDPNQQEFYKRFMKIRNKRKTLGHRHTYLLVYFAFVAKAVFVIGCVMLFIYAEEVENMAQPVLMKVPPFADKPQPADTRNLLTDTKKKAPSTAYGTFPLTVGIADQKRVPYIVFDHRASSRTRSEFSTSQTGRLKLRISNAGERTLISLRGRVEWVSESGQILATKELVMVKPDIRLYAGESSVAYQAQFSLNLAVKSARIVVTQVEFGSTAVQRTGGQDVCVNLEGSANTLKVEVKSFPTAQNSLLSKALYAVTNMGDDIDELSAFQEVFDSKGRRIEKGSQNDILNRQIVSSNLMPVFKKGETRFIAFNRFIDKETNAKIAKTCLNLTRNTGF